MEGFAPPSVKPERESARGRIASTTLILPAHPKGLTFRDARHYLRRSGI
jgi:hypothetical protein